MTAKTKTKNNQKLSKPGAATAVFGYSLFILTIISVVLWTIIPWATVLSGPTVRHLNVTVLLIAFVAAAILPVLGSYLFGDRATRSKDKTLHRHNGVLFAIAAYWLASAFTFTELSQAIHAASLPPPLVTVMVTGIPIIFALGVMAYVAITYAKKRKNTPAVVNHRPYQVVLGIAALWFFASMAVSQSYNLDTFWYAAVSLAFPAALTTISYRVLAKFHSSKSARFTDAIIAMSFGSITLTVIYPFVAALSASDVATTIVSYLIGLVVWIAYVFLRNRNNA